MSRRAAVIAIAFAAIIPLSPKSRAEAEKRGTETWASVETTIGPRRYGRLEIRDDKLLLTEPAGAARDIDLATVSLIECDTPRLVAFETFVSGPLPEPWKQAAVGELPFGGNAEVKAGHIVVETSSPKQASEFGAFYMAYRPLPEGDAQITATVTRIETYVETTRAGVMLRDGTGPDARNVFLSLSHREPAMLRQWQSQGGSTITDRRSDIRPGSWLRLVRASGTVSGLVSTNGGLWREIGRVEDQFEGPVYACLVSQGAKPRNRWASSFKNLDVTTLDVLGPVRRVRPKIVLVDGTSFHSEIDSASRTLFKLGGENAGRALPLLTVSRIEFFSPIPHERRVHFSGERPGVLLADGDFFESSLASIEGSQMVTTSPLFGKRNFDLQADADALVLRDAPDAPPTNLPFRLDTWSGGKLSGKAIRIEDGQLTIDTVRLRSQHIPLLELRSLRLQN